MANSYDVFFEELQLALRKEGGVYNSDTGTYATDDDPWAIQRDSDNAYWANIARVTSELDAERCLDFA